MKKIGIAGGISWTSTMEYYRIINEKVNEQLGGLNFAECVIYSLNFEHFRNSNAAHDWDQTYQLLSKAVFHLEDAGADCIVLAANTAHIVAERIKEKILLPLIDIREATANAVRKKQIRKVGLLGTIYTMELDFYRDKLLEFGVEAIIPSNQVDREYIEETLVHELGRGILNPATKERYIRIAEGLIRQGAGGIVLGCTEIPLLLSQADFTIPVFDTTQIHAQAAVEFSLSNP